MFHFYLDCLSFISIVSLLLSFNSTPSSTLGEAPCPKEALADAVWEFTGETAPHHSGFTAGLRTHLLIGVATTTSAVVLKLACQAFQWIPVGYFRGFLFSGLLAAPLLVPAQKLIPYRSCDYQWFLLICLYFRGQRDAFSPGFVGKLVDFRSYYSIALWFFLFVCLFCSD